MRKINCSSVWLLLIVLLTTLVYADVAVVWGYRGNTYPTQAQALGAMQAAKPGSSVVTVEARVSR